MKNWFITHFSFSRKEIQGIAFLTFALGIVWSLPFIYKLIGTKEVDPKFESRKQEIISFVQQNSGNEGFTSQEVEVPVPREKPEYFPFDPNTLSEEEGQRLGLSAAQIRMIHNYRNKGGRFYDKADLARIYAITEEDYKRLSPYVQIKNQQKTRRSGKGNNPPKNIHSGYPLETSDLNAASGKPPLVKKPEKQIMINLNTTDSIELLDLYGIGPSFASRMIKYRDLLGGYHSKDQLLEVYGMDEERYAGFHGDVFVNPDEVQKIEINIIGYRELLKHPYITPRQANAIVQYRIQHGNYNEANDLLKIEILNEDFLRKIVPYLSLDNVESDHEDNGKEASHGNP